MCRKVEQLNLFIDYENGISSPSNYANGYEYLAFSGQVDDPIEMMNCYKNYILKQMKYCSSDEAFKQWQNAIISIERQIKDFERIINDNKRNDEQQIK